MADSLKKEIPPVSGGAQRKNITWLAIIIVLLVTGLAVIVYLYYDQKDKMEEMEVVLTEEKDSLANELQDLIFNYDTLKTSNDSLNQKLEEEQNKIRMF